MKALPRVFWTTPVSSKDIKNSVYKVRQQSTSSHLWGLHQQGACKKYTKCNIGFLHFSVSSMLGLADVSMYPFSLLPCILCRYQYAARSPCIHIGSHLQAAHSSSAPLPQSLSQMGLWQQQVYLWTHKIGSFMLRGVSLLQPNPLPICFSCDKILACFLWETWSVKWFGVGFFSQRFLFFFPETRR